LGIVTTLRAGAVRFRLYPQDHPPIHAHGRYAESLVIVQFEPDRSVTIAAHADAVLPRNAKANDIRKILEAAAERYDAIVAAWHKMHET